MNSLIFKIKWLIKFRTRFLFSDHSQRNIALVVNSFDKGGLEQVVLNLYYGYKKQGYNVYILSAFNNAPLAKRLYDLRDIHIFNNNPENFIQFCWDKKINVLHYNYNTLMIRAVRQMGFKIIYTMHNVYTWFATQELINYKQRLDSAHYVVCVSEYVKDYYISKTGAKNAVTIANGIDFAPLDKVYHDIPISRERLGIKHGQKVIGTVASFYPVKHQIGMIGVMEQLIKSHPEAILLCIGNVGDKDYYDAFSKLLQFSSAKNNIKHINYIDNKYMGQFLQEAVDIFALASLQEGFGNAPMEAMYAKKPILVTDTGGARDIQKFSSVVVVKPAYSDIKSVTKEQMDAISLQKENINTQEIVLALEKILDNFEDFSKKAQATQLNMEDFTIDAMMNKYIKLIE